MRRQPALGIENRLRIATRRVRPRTPSLGRLVRVLALTVRVRGFYTGN